MPPETAQVLPARACEGCGALLAPALLSCPSCRRLVHAEDLKRLAEEARSAAERSDPASALAAWRRALELLPRDSAQFGRIAGTVVELSREVERSGARPAQRPVPSARSPSALGASLAGLGVFGLMLWKFKFVLVFLLTKAKFLLMGLGKASTFLSMFVFFGAEWARSGWAFAAGLVVSLYIHEMGHVAALRRYGIAATAPMFIPGLGAFIRAKQSLILPREDARVGLAGPMWGLGAALAAYAVSLAVGGTLWAAVAKLGAWINLFNLLPLGPLDGGRGFRSMTRSERWVAVAALAGAWAVTEEGLLALLSLVAAARAFGRDAAAEPDPGNLARYVFLVAALSALSSLPVGG